MNCDDALNLINARNDGEIDRDDAVRLDAHLGACATCRAELEVVSSQHAKLREAFRSHRSLARGVADRVVEHLPRRPKRRVRAGWWSTIASAAAGFLVAWAIFHDKGVVPVVSHPAQEIAHLTLATGEVECQPTGQSTWSVLPTGARVTAGTRLRTGDGVRCEFRTIDGSEIRLDEKTEIALQSARRFELAGGQAWSSVAHQASQPFEAVASTVTFTALGTQFDLRTKPDETSLTVVEGSVRADGGGKTVVVEHGKQFVCAPGRLGNPRPVENLAMATRWVNEILVLKGRDDPELNRRIDDLFAQIGDQKMSFMYEEEVRALGDHCVIPLVRYLQSDRSTGHDAKRVLAAKIVADVAPPWAIPELMALLNDENGEVRESAATALKRLTGQDQGRSPAKWREDSVYACSPSSDAWQKWWARNKGRYPGAGEVVSKKVEPLKKG